MRKTIYIIIKVPAIKKLTIPGMYDSSITPSQVAKLNKASVMKPVIRKMIIKNIKIPLTTPLLILIIYFPFYYCLLRRKVDLLKFV